MLGGYCTRDEFGLSLYETVATISGILGLQTQIAGVIHRGEDKKLPDLKARREALRATLHAQMLTLSNAEMGPLLTRYPIVATL